jgi:hypothetical protein
MSIAGSKMTLRPPTIPYAPRSIQKGTPLKVLLNQEAVECLAQNILFAQADFEAQRFCECALTDLEPLELMQRGQHRSGPAFLDSFRGRDKWDSTV